MKRWLPWLAALAIACPALAAQKTAVVTETTTTIHIPAADYDRWQRMGYTTSDIFQAYNVAAASNRKVDDVFAMRKAGKSWDTIAMDTRIGIHQVYGVPSSMVAGQRMVITGTTMTGLAVPITGYPLYERKLPDSFFKDGYTLTPQAYSRWRAAGLTRDQAYMVANASRVTGIDPGHFINRIYQGATPQSLGIQFGITPSELTKVNPEWRSPMWAAAVDEPMFTREKLDMWW